MTFDGVGSPEYNMTTICISAAAGPFYSGNNTAVNK